MHIRVDADACPAVIKDIPFHVADRLPLTLVANRCAGAAVAPYPCTAGADRV